MLAWWEERCNKQLEGLPLTLVVPAEAIRIHDPIELLANLLEQRADYHPKREFWERRLAMWQKDRARLPKILLVIDGLNQKPVGGEFEFMQQ